MLNIGLLSLIFAMASGVFGFAADAPPDWTWQKTACLAFLLVAAISLIAGTIDRPRQLWREYSTRLAAIGLHDFPHSRARALAGDQHD
jgi:hypothetical protein